MMAIYDHADELRETKLLSKYNYDRLIQHHINKGKIKHGIKPETPQESELELYRMEELASNGICLAAFTRVRLTILTFILLGSVPYVTKIAFGQKALWNSFRFHVS